MTVTSAIIVISADRSAAISLTSLFMTVAVSEPGSVLHAGAKRNSRWLCRILELRREPARPLDGLGTRVPGKRGVWVIGRRG